jgi:hypothetical protein
MPDTIDDVRDDRLCGSLTELLDVAADAHVRQSLESAAR